MKAFFLVVFLLLLADGKVFAQQRDSLSPIVSWTFEANELEEQEYELVAIAKVKDFWAIYSEKIKKDKGPFPLSFEVSYDEAIELVGSVEESGKTQVYWDSMYQIQITKLSGIVQLRQRIRVNDPKVRSVKGFISYMAVHENTACIPPKEIEFDIKLF